MAKRADALAKKTISKGEWAAARICRHACQLILDKWICHILFIGYALTLNVKIAGARMCSSISITRSRSLRSCPEKRVSYFSMSQTVRYCVRPRTFFIMWNHCVRVAWSENYLYQYFAAFPRWKQRDDVSLSSLRFRSRVQPLYLTHVTWHQYFNKLISRYARFHGGKIYGHERSLLSKYKFFEYEKCKIFRTLHTQAQQLDRSRNIAPTMPLRVHYKF